MLLKTTVLIAVLQCLWGSGVEGANMMGPPGADCAGWDDRFAGFGVPPVGFGENGVGFDDRGGYGAYGLPPMEPMQQQFGQQPQLPQLPQLAPQNQQPSAVKHSVTSCHKVERTLPSDAPLPSADSVKWRPKAGKDYRDSDSDDDDDEPRRRRGAGRGMRRRESGRERKIVVITPESDNAGKPKPQGVLSNPLPIISSTPATAPPAAAPPAQGRTKRELQDCKEELKALKGRLESKQKEKDEEEEVAVKKEKKKPGRVKRLLNKMRGKKDDDGDEVADADAADAEGETGGKKGKKGKKGTMSKKGKKSRKGEQREDEEEEENGNGSEEKKDKKGMSKGAKAGLAAAGVTTGLAALAVPAIIAALADKKKAGGVDGGEGGPLAGILGKFFSKPGKGDSKVQYEAKTDEESVLAAIGLAAQPEAERTGEEKLAETPDVTKEKNAPYAAAQQEALKPTLLVATAAPPAVPATTAPPSIAMPTLPADNAEVLVDPPTATVQGPAKVLVDAELVKEPVVAALEEKMDEIKDKLEQVVAASALAATPPATSEPALNVAPLITPAQVAELEAAQAAKKLTAQVAKQAEELADMNATVKQLEGVVKAATDHPTATEPALNVAPLITPLPVDEQVKEQLKEQAAELADIKAAAKQLQAVVQSALEPAPTKVTHTQPTEPLLSEPSLALTLEEEGKLVGLKHTEPAATSTTPPPPLHLVTSGHLTNSQTPITAAAHVKPGEPDKQVSEGVKNDLDNLLDALKGG